MAAALLFQGVPTGYADGIPTSDPLVYSGRVVQGGTPAAGVSVQVDLFDNPSGGMLVCTSAGTTVVSDSAGRFAVTLPAACAAGVRRIPDLWVDVKLNGATTGRAPVKAVPYAIEAERAKHVSRPIMRSPSGVQFSLNAMPCRETSATKGFITNHPVRTTAQGYHSAKYYCEQSCASPSAHMCTADEMNRYFALEGDGSGNAARVFADGGALPPEAWIASAGGGLHNGTTFISTDCFGYKYEQAANYGTVWMGIQVQQELRACSTPLPILCCD